MHPPEIILYARTMNLGTWACLARVEFEVYRLEGGLALGAYTSVVLLVPSQTTEVTSSWTSLLPGHYSVRALAWHESNGDGNPDPLGPAMKSFNIDVT